ncbi:hypothetical protein C6T59_28805 [Burkholderia multivorans]|nr:hypothetical protein C6Q01_14210 [Burkholderia multivorans]PRG59794.1 hypothetical protein C6T59_28805 [Burkholderia multivorans]
MHVLHVLHVRMHSIRDQHAVCQFAAGDEPSISDGSAGTLADAARHNPARAGFVSMSLPGNNRHTPILL